ncbi:transglutaminase-like domain-containing protein [Oceanibaculum indicum]|uniref:Transglutaminase superfamily protein n=1 Tax=Oceanibaculum indicum TaxID=526216 RepID=A0A420WR74_9PROT|nr:transglutaminase-like domain-containing protein [Oceanibaculum indicum]RKQ73356.1 transglutaminase superfamily protein [Oceanibaculum indicum]
MTLIVTVQLQDRAADHGALGLLVPCGISTNRQRLLSFEPPQGSRIRLLPDRDSDQMVAFVEAPSADRLTLRYGFAAETGGLSEQAFLSTDNRWSRAVRALAAEAETIARAAGYGRTGIQALVEATAAKFRYGHPAEKYYDGQDAIPHLGCGLTEGSCVDINAYLMASLRSAGYEAAYIAGYFFPRERDGLTNDMHCWVATRHEGEILEWDIAHHMKMGEARIAAAYNPKPGERWAVGYGLGHRFQLDDREVEMKLLAEPMWLLPDDRLADALLEIRVS